MKKLLTLFAFTFTLLAQAEGITDIKKGDLNLSQAVGELVSVKVLCPQIPGRMSCAAYGSTATIKVTLSGCLDRLGGHFTKFEQVNGRGILYFGALNIFNEKSMTARCVALPTKIIKVNIPFEGEVELVSMDYTGMTAPKN